MLQIGKSGNSLYPEIEEWEVFVLGTNLEFTWLANLHNYMKITIQLMKWYLSEQYFIEAMLEFIYCIYGQCNEDEISTCIF